MNKSDLVDAVASSADLTKASAARAVDATLDAIGGALGNGDSASLVGFGTFSVRPTSTSSRCSKSSTAAWITWLRRHGSSPTCTSA